ncbi:uncharacterized protein LOC144652615 [Oculina patagonica]
MFSKRFFYSTSLGRKGKTFGRMFYPMILTFCLLASVCYGSAACTSSAQNEYYKSCKEIRTHIPNSLSGLYTIQPVPDGKVITVYCEMAIAGGGFTFVPRTAIRAIENQQLISELFTDRTQVLMRIQKKDVTQPYTLVEQLPEYKQHLLGVRVNNYDGYTSPVNSHLGDYLLLGILPPDVAGVDRKVLGFQSNGKALRYTNCGGSRHNLFAFLPDHSELPPSDAHSGNLIYEREGMAVNWRNTAILPPSGRTMPNEFFFLTEIHMGGCGCYTSSDRWTDALGTAIGFR